MNGDDQFTPELLELWQEAMVNLRARRNRAVLWQAPIFILFWLISFSILGEKVAFLVFAVGLSLGLLAQSMRPNYDYTVSDDRLSAKFHLNHIFRIKYLFVYPIEILRKNAVESMGGLLIAIAAFVTLPIWWGFTSLRCSLELFNYLWWLKGFNEWTGRLQKIAASSDERQHLRGTNILPSVQLSGTAPTEAAPPPIQQGPLEVLDGLLTLFPDGGIALVGGVVFDRHSTFSNFSMNGLTLTRESEAQLKVSHEGSNRSFGFDGSSWKEI